MSARESVPAAFSLFFYFLLLSPSGPGAANRDARAGPDRAVTVTAVAAGAGPPKLAVETQCGPARHGDSDAAEP